jgi:hypothetical protein
LSSSQSNSSSDEMMDEIGFNFENESNTEISEEISEASINRVSECDVAVIGSVVVVALVVFATAADDADADDVASATVTATGEILNLLGALRFSKILPSRLVIGFNANLAASAFVAIISVYNDLNSK